MTVTEYKGVAVSRVSLYTGLGHSLLSVFTLWRPETSKRVLCQTVKTQMHYIAHSLLNKKDSMDQKSIQSSSTPVPEYQIEK